MKILHVCHNYFPSAGGPQYTMKHISEMFADEYGDEVEVCTTDSFYGPESPVYKKISPAQETINGVYIKRVPIIKWHHPFIKYGSKITGKLFGKALPPSVSKYRLQMHAPGIDKTMKITEADVIMATTAMYMFADYSISRWKTQNAKPFVLYGAIHFKDGLCDKASLKRAINSDCYIANTVYEKDRLVNFGADPSKIMVIGTGVNIEVFKENEQAIIQFRQQHNIGSADIVIGFVGKIKTGKGVDILLSAFEKIYQNNKNIKLLLAGSSTEHLAVIKKKIAHLALPVIVAADFNDELKPVLYNVIDMLVLPSPGESFGVVFLEAWSCKKPVIGANIGAVASLINDWQDGLLFEPGNEVNLIEKINILIANTTLRKTLGSNGYKKVVSKFTWPVIAEAYRNTYLQAIENFNRIKINGYKNVIH